MKRIINEIKGTLSQEKQTFSDGGETDGVVKGWIEGLEYVLGLLTDENSLSKKEVKNINARLDQIEKEQLVAWGLHRISGGFVTADLDVVDDDKINIVITDGVQSDCENRVNKTFCSLWRDTLEYTD